MAILLGLCAFGGWTIWSLWSSHQSTGWSTVTVIVRNDVDKQPIPGVEVQFHDRNNGLPVVVPQWISQRNRTYRGEDSVTTDSLGKATIRIPKHVRPNEQIRFGIGVNALSIPRGLAYRIQEGQLFGDDPIVIWLKPTPNLLPLIATPSPPDGQIPQQAEEQSPSASPTSVTDPKSPP